MEHKFITFKICSLILTSIGTIVWLFTIGLCMFKFATMPELKAPRLISDQLEYYYPYTELFFVSSLIAIIAIVVFLHQSEKNHA